MSASQRLPKAQAEAVNEGAARQKDVKSLVGAGPGSLCAVEEMPLR